jgi:hypothetical protein
MKLLINQVKTNIQRADMLLAGLPGTSHKKTTPVSTGQATHHTGRV